MDRLDRETVRHTARLSSMTGLGGQCQQAFSPRYRQIDIRIDSEADGQWVDNLGLVPGIDRQIESEIKCQKNIDRMTLTDIDQI